MSSCALALAVRPVKSGRRGRAAVCGLLVFAQVIAFSHVALVAHRICAEHGEAIHASQQAEASTPLAPDGSLASVLPVRGAVLGHDHEHCLCMAHGRERCVVPPRTRVGPVAIWIDQRWQGSPRSVSALPVELFLLAPKGSPPALL